jgi:iron complex outermembrane recepter protein
MISTTRLLLSASSLAVTAFSGAGVLAQANAPAAAPAGPSVSDTTAIATPGAPAVAGAAQAPAAEIVVTGSRLGASGFTTPTPVTVLGTAKIATRAPGTIADVVNQIPSFRQTSGPSQSQRFSANNGQNNLDLRGLGPTRTLMLIDGRRQSTTDTNVIPIALVDRVEVVTGGASAAYGSDAVAGVVNFVLKDKLDGIQGSAQYGITSRGDGAEPSINLAAGTSFADDRGHVLAGLDYDDNHGIGRIYERAWGREQAGLVSFGSAASRGGLPAQGFLPGITYSAQTPGGVITSGPLKNTAFGPGGAPFAFDQGTVYSNVMQGGSNPGMNPGGNFPIEVPLKRLATLAKASFDVSDNFKVYAQGAYAEVKGYAYTSYLQLPSIIVSINNPYLPSETRAAAIAAGVNPATGTLNVGRTFTELGGYDQFTDRKTLRGVVGASGKVLGGWKWDVSYQYARTKDTLYDPTDVLVSNLQQAAYAVRDGSGNIVCGNVASNPNLSASSRALIASFQQLNPSAQCAPMNIFGYGSPSAASLKYITGAGLKNSSTSTDVLQVAAANVSGSPFSTWAGPVELALGGEYRTEKLHAVTDALSLIQAWGTNNGAHFQGDLNVKEAYVELGVPLAKDMPFAHSLDLNAAGRYTDYSTSGSVETWKVGLTYEPVRSIRLRVTRSRDIRAPNLTDLYSQGATVLISNIVNPINNQTGLLTTIPQGNPDLKAEKADTLTGGIVFQPTASWLRGFRASVDYYSIKVAGVITSYTAQEVLRRCAAGESSFCNFIGFNGSQFGIASMVLEPFNLNKLNTSGLDIELSYRMPLDKMGLPGALTLHGLATHVFHLKTTDSTGTIDRAGSLQQNGVPAWTANVDLTYQLGGFSSTLTGRYFSAVKYDATLIGPDSPNYNPALSNSINDNTMPSRTYFDLALSYDVINDQRHKLEFFTTVTNLFDKQPPYNAFLVSSGGNPYDLIGRTYKVGVRFAY